jgi:hypothetical protein
MVGTSMGPALAISMQENPLVAADSAKLADIFNASRRLKSDIVFSRLSGMTSDRRAAAHSVWNTKPIDLGVNENRLASIRIPRRQYDSVEMRSNACLQ